MKKYLLGLFAIAMAIGFSAFTAPKKGETDYSWFRQSDHEFMGITQSLTENPLDCYGDGDGCIKAYEGDLSSSPEPASGFVIAYEYE